MNADDVKRERSTKEKRSTTVLVVEDYDETRFMLKVSLELSGYRVLEAVNGEEAVAVAQREDPDLILMDIGLPVLDGFAATRLIREDPGLRDVPIVAVTAHGTPEYRVKALAVGCNEFVTKPIDYDRLNSVLIRLIKPSDETEAAG